MEDETQEEMPILGVETGGATLGPWRPARARSQGAFYHDNLSSCLQYYSFL